SRSEATLVAILAVMKAGGAFTPLDMRAPRTWVEERIDELGIKVVLTEQDLDSDPAAEDLIGVDVEPSQVAYILHTSGSTGRPKVCAGGQAWLARFLAWARSFSFGDGEGEAFAFFPSLGLDLTLTSLFLPLVSGRSVRVVPESDPGAELKQALSCVGAV